ncbi:hypothetical protein [Deinococcus carri]|uniref:hypothetical protein n=1 Tax=Deinococcus carri TaxID=1211323 RepID=UPI0031ED6115
MKIDYDSTELGTISAYGLTQGGYEAAFQELQSEGVEPGALRRMSDTLHAARALLGCYPDALQVDPDEVLARRAGIWKSA